MWPSKKHFLEICEEAKLSSNPSIITGNKPMHLQKKALVPYMHETDLNTYFHWHKSLE